VLANENEQMDYGSDEADEAGGAGWLTAGAGGSGRYRDPAAGTPGWITARARRR
jgi:hypothetical protein